MWVLESVIQLLRSLQIASSVLFCISVGFSSCAGTISSCKSSVYINPSLKNKTHWIWKAEWCKARDRDLPCAGVLLKWLCWLMLGQADVRNRSRFLAMVQAPNSVHVFQVGGRNSAIWAIMYFVPRVQHFSRKLESRWRWGLKPGTPVCDVDVNRNFPILPSKSFYPMAKFLQWLQGLCWICNHCSF